MIKQIIKENNKTFEQKINSKEWGGWKIVSDMLDNPDESGIYPTSKCYEKLHDFVVEMLRQAQEDLLKTIIKELGVMEKSDMTNECDCGREVEFAGFGYNRAVSDIEKLLEEKNKKLKRLEKGLEKRLEKELFDMVYQWGRVGIVTDEKCNAFQDLLSEIKELIKTN